MINWVDPFSDFSGCDELLSTSRLLLTARYFLNCKLKIQNEKLG